MNTMSSELVCESKESICVWYELVAYGINKDTVYYDDYVRDEWLLVRMIMPNWCGCDDFLEIVKM